MTNSQRLEAIRRHLQAWFATQTDGQPWESSESILIRDGFYCGRCFQMPGFRAVWFFEEEEIKVYRSTGELLATFSGNQLFSTTTDKPTLRMYDQAERISANDATKDGSEAFPARRAA